MHAGIQHFGGVGRRLPHFFESKYDSLAEWSKALASGASPQGRGLEPHSCHIVPQTRPLRRMYPKRKKGHNPKFLTTDQNPNPKLQPPISPEPFIVTANQTLSPGLSPPTEP